VNYMSCALATNRRLGSHDCISALLLLLLPAAVSAQSGKVLEMNLHYERAERALKASKLDVAETEFRQLLRLDPQNAAVYANLGVIEYTRGDYVDAEQDFRKSVTLQPSLWNAQAFLGMCNLRLGNADEAQALLEKSLPHLQQAKLIHQAGTDLIQAYYRRGNLDKAVGVIRILENSAPDDPEVLYQAYRTYSDLAAHALSRLARVAPTSGRMYEILGQSLMSQNDFPSAIQQYQKALQIDPHLPGIHFELGQAILANSTDEQARNEATREFNAALAENPKDANSEYELGEIAWLHSNLQGALRHYLRAIEFRSGFVDAQIGAGKVLTAMNEPQKGLDHLLAAERFDPDNEVVHYRLAMAYRRLGRAADADREWVVFQRLRKSKLPIRYLYQQIQQRPITKQAVRGEEPK